MTVKINNTLIRQIAQEKSEKVREFWDLALRGFIARQQALGFITYLRNNF